MGISFAMAITIVVAIHLAVIGGFYFYTPPKPKIEGVKTASQESTTIPPGPKSDALVRNEWPQPDAKPKVVATPVPARKKEIASKPAANPKPFITENKPALKSVVQTSKKQIPLDRIDKDEAAKKAFLATRSGQLASEATAPTQSPQAGQIAEVTSAKVAVPSPGPIAAAPAKAAEAQVVKNHPTRVTEYTLSAGDNLYLVSRKLGVSYNELARTNGIDDPRQLRVGQTLKVPAVASL